MLLSVPDSGFWKWDP